MTIPTTTVTTTAARDMLIWETLLERLADSDDDEGQLAALRVLAALDTDDLPIEAITTVLLDQTQDEDGTLHLADADDLWSEGLNLIECDPDRVPLEPVIAVLRAAFMNGTDTQMLLDLIGKLRGIDHPEPFIDLLTDAEPLIRQAGLEAMYRLSLSAPILPLLEDPDPDTRALAVENAWVLHALTLDELQAFLYDDQPQAVRDMAQSYLDSAAKAQAQVK